MKCPICKGTGKTYKASVDLYSRCDECRGTGEIVRTNEEWLKSMTTEELAIWIERIMFIVRNREDVEDGAYMQMMTKKDYIESWLMEKHHDD